MEAEMMLIVMLCFSASLFIAAIALEIWAIRGWKFPMLSGEKILRSGASGLGVLLIVLAFGIPLFSLLQTTGIFVFLPYDPNQPNQEVQTLLGIFACTPFVGLVVGAATSLSLWMHLNTLDPQKSEEN